MYTVYSDQSRARALTRATGAGESDVSWNSSGGASLLSSSAIDTRSDNFYYLSVDPLTRLLAYSLRGKPTRVALT